MVRAERIERDTHLCEPKDLTYTATSGLSVDSTTQR